MPNPDADTLERSRGGWTSPAAAIRRWRGGPADQPGDRRGEALVSFERCGLAGLAVHGPRNVVDKVFKGLTLHP
ncbi:MAG TPA: hypothetical protein VKD26_14050 [Streptosporangiaceae bacterium]|nr:hypothetical protein [Streptosporangiaceae bacterium]